MVLRTLLVVSLVLLGCGANPTGPDGGAGGGGGGGGGGSMSATALPVPVIIFMHSEDPNHPETPDFSNPASWDTYVAFRRALVAFAQQLKNAGLVWDFQPDWNFTLAVYNFEVRGMPPTGHTTAEVQALLAESGDKNVYRYLAEDMGVQIDPHSHEGSSFGGTQYNYADVAHLISQVGVTPSGIVGGHVISGTTFQNWPRFKAAVACQAYASAPSCAWQAEALMGGGTASHVNEESGSGIWRPTEPGSPPDYTRYWKNDAASSLVAIGNWPAEGGALSGLITQIERGSLSSTKLFTATQGFNHSELVTQAYGALDANDRVTQTTMNAAALSAFVSGVLAPLLPLQTSGKAEFVTFNQALARWRRAFASTSSLCKNTVANQSTCQPAF